jgi:hypothetical protein
MIFPTTTFIQVAIYFVETFGLRDAKQSTKRTLFVIFSSQQFLLVESEHGSISISTPSNLTYIVMTVEICRLTFNAFTCVLVALMELKSLLELRRALSD